MPRRVGGDDPADGLGAGGRRDRGRAREAGRQYPDDGVSQTEVRVISAKHPSSPATFGCFAEATLERLHSKTDGGLDRLFVPLTDEQARSCSRIARCTQC